MKKPNAYSVIKLYYVMYSHKYLGTPFPTATLHYTRLHCITLNSDLIALLYVPQHSATLRYTNYSTLRTVVGKSKWYYQVFQDSFHLKR